MSNRAPQRIPPRRPTSAPAPVQTSALATLAGEWLEHLASVRRLRPSSVWTHRRALEKAVAHLEHLGYTEWRQVEGSRLHEYLAALREDRQPRATLRAFFAWLEQSRDAAPPAQVLELLAPINRLRERGSRPQSRPWRPRRGWSEDEATRQIRGLEARVEQWRHPKVTDLRRGLNVPRRLAIALRDLAIVEVLWASGLRSAELRALELTDLQLTKRELFIRMGKGSRDRVAIFGGHAETALRAWLGPEGRPQLARESTSPNLFLSSIGRRLTNTSLNIVTRGCARGVGLTSAAGPHKWRHSFAGILLARGCGLREIQELGGWASITSVERYTYVDAEHVTRSYRKHFPRG